MHDDRRWRIGAQSEVDWIREHTVPGLTITSAIPPAFAGYATVLVPDDEAPRRAGESELLRLLIGQSPDQPWWLGYLDTGGHDVVFADAAPVTLYAGWSYVLVEAGPAQAGSWRGELPDLIFPADRSWLVSTLWDDDWRCLGGPDSLIAAVLAASGLSARRVAVDEDATPPGHVAR